MSQEIELRVLTGHHSGARAVVHGGERIGATDDCDLVLTDLGLGNDAIVWLNLRSGHWSFDTQMPELSSESSAQTEALAHPLGAIAYLGEQAVMVCEVNRPWSPALQTHQHESSTLDSDAQEPVYAIPELKKEVHLLQKKATQAEVAEIKELDGEICSLPDELRLQATGIAEHQPATGAVSKAHKMVLLTVTLLIFMLLALAWGVSAGRGNVVPLPANAPEAPMLDSARQQQLLRDAQLAIARVDPALRLKTEVLSQDGVRVSGWVADVNQLDRLAESLATLRPLPQLAVRTASDLRDDMMDAAGSEVRNPAFEFMGAGRVKVSGLVQNAAERDRVLTAVRGRVPEDMEIISGLRIAAEQGPAMIEWFKRMGFHEVTADWREEQMHIAVDIARADRGRLEDLLLRKNIPLTEIPFLLKVTEVAGYMVAVPSAVELVHASAAPSPIRMRSVVGGDVPYVVLLDGTRLQPGGQRGGWTLEAVESDRIVFKGPRTLVVAR